jgi:hypothetical protein
LVVADALFICLISVHPAGGVTTVVEGWTAIEAIMTSLATVPAGTLIVSIGRADRKARMWALPTSLLAALPELVAVIVPVAPTAP